MLLVTSHKWAVNFSRYSMSSSSKENYKGTLMYKCTPVVMMTRTMMMMSTRIHHWQQQQQLHQPLAMCNSTRQGSLAQFYFLKNEKTLSSCICRRSNGILNASYFWEAAHIVHHENADFCVGRKRAYWIISHKSWFIAQAYAKLRYSNECFGKMEKSTANL